MATFNRVLRKVSVGTVTKGASEIQVTVATHTSKWNGPEFLALQQGPGFLQTVETRKDLVPEGTKEVCQRETVHPSTDPRNHYTAVCFDANGEGTSVHFPVDDKGNSQ